MNWIALLRAVNVAGHKPVAMPELKRVIADLGFSNARSILQSGNLVFSSGLRLRDADIERMLEQGARDGIGLQTDFFVRSAAQWRTIVAANPFREEAQRDPAHLVVALTKAAIKAADVEALRASIVGPEKVSARDRHLYVVYPTGIGRSRLTNALIERKLGTRATARNWNTVLKVAQMSAD